MHQKIAYTNSAEYYVLKLKDEEIYFNTFDNIFYYLKTKKEFCNNKFSIEPNLNNAMKWHLNEYNNALEYLKNNKFKYISKLFEIIKVKCSIIHIYERENV